MSVPLILVHFKYRGSALWTACSLPAKHRRCTTQRWQVSCELCKRAAARVAA